MIAKRVELGQRPPTTIINYSHYTIIDCIKYQISGISFLSNVFRTESKSQSYTQHKRSELWISNLCQRSKATNIIMYTHTLAQMGRQFKVMGKMLNVDDSKPFCTFFENPFWQSLLRFIFFLLLLKHILCKYFYSYYLFCMKFI